MATSNENTLTTITCTKGAATRVRDVSVERGMHQYRVVELLLALWEAATEEQHQEAERVTRANAKRQTQLA